jgi:hypothetical protein
MSSAIVSTSPSAGDAIPPDCELIEVRVRELRQLFSMIDPSPFDERDLAPDAEEFIVNWARDVPRSSPLALLVHLDRPAGTADEASLLRDAVQQFFDRREAAARRRLRDLFRRGRVSLLIGFAFLGVLGVVANMLGGLMPGALGGVLRESFLIGGWVAMWRPLEVFLYDWWPIRAEARLFGRLATMPVRVQYTDGSSDDWRRDWPVAPAAASKD